MTLSDVEEPRVVFSLLISAPERIGVLCTSLSSLNSGLTSEKVLRTVYSEPESLFHRFRCHAHTLYLSSAFMPLRLGTSYGRAGRQQSWKSVLGSLTCIWGCAQISDNT